MACEYILEQVKLKVSIWKKEVYESGKPKQKAKHPESDQGAMLGVSYLRLPGLNYHDTLCT